jgi:hypothetical protein
MAPDRDAISTPLNAWGLFRNHMQRVLSLQRFRRRTYPQMKMIEMISFFFIFTICGSINGGSDMHEVGSRQRAAVFTLDLRLHGHTAKQ